MKGPEKDRHIDDRVAHLGATELAELFGSTPTAQAMLPRENQIVTPERWARAYAGRPEAAAAVAAADALIDSPPDVMGRGLGRSRTYGFHYLGWLQPLITADAITADARFLDSFSDLVTRWTASRDDVVGEWPGLDPIWYTLGCWARGKHLLAGLTHFGDRLPDEAASAIVGTLVGGARWEYDEHDRFRHGNWQVAGATNLIMVASAFPQLDEAPAWLARGMERLHEHLLLDFYPDGGHYERAPSYHAMCLTELQTAAYLGLLRGDASLLTSGVLGGAHRWLTDMTTAGGWATPFQDSGLIWPAPLLVTGSWLLGDPDLRARAAWHLDDDAVAALTSSLPPHPDVGAYERWASPTPTRFDAESLWLRDSGYTVLGAGRADGLRVTLNHGPLIEHELESHSHRAALDVVVDHAGVPVIWEAGGPDSYDDPAYQTWFQAARGHSTVTVGDTDTAPDRDARSDGLWTTPVMSHVRARHHGHGPEQVRDVRLVGDADYVVVWDRSDGTPGDYTQRWHAPVPWSGAGESWSAVGHVVARGGTVSATGEGPARVPRPEPDSAAFATIHTLASTNDTGSYTTVLATNPVTTTADADTLTVMTPAGEDVHTPDSFLRYDRTGPTLLTSAWSLAGTISADGVALVQADGPTTMTRTDTGWRISIEASRRHQVRLALPDTHQVALAGVVLPDGEDGVMLPAGGTWLVEVTR